jgi:hypothetical protein
MKSGNKISKNFQLKCRIDTFEHLLKVLDSQKSMFWRHAVFPTAVVEQQQLSALKMLIRYGHLWEIERIENKNN